MPGFLRRTWAEIDLDALIHNYNMAKKASGTEVMAVVKADAYGHGARHCAEALSGSGAKWFGVSNIDEALELRRVGIDKNILILGHTPVEYANIIHKENISQTIFSPEYARDLAESAKSVGISVCAHVKLDTGMNRLGFRCIPGFTEDSANEIIGIFKGGGLVPQGIFTHFAVSDESNDKAFGFTEFQSGQFYKMVSILHSKGLDFEFRHLCPSGGIFSRNQDGADMVRAGIMLYGYPPDPGLESPGIRLNPVLSLKSIITEIHEIGAGESVSYGCTFTPDTPRKIATVAAGYADGYPRSLSNRGRALVGGESAKIAGRVCMDQLMLDITHITRAGLGDTVTLIGRDGAAEITAAEIAEMTETIPYEILCGVSRRVPRIYYQGGKRGGFVNYLDN